VTARVTAALESSVSDRELMPAGGSTLRRLSPASSLQGAGGMPAPPSAHV